jgi:hypothetical protein
VGSKLEYVSRRPGLAWKWSPDASEEILTQNSIADWSIVLLNLRIKDKDIIDRNFDSLHGGLKWEKHLDQTSPLSCQPVTAPMVLDAEDQVIILTMDTAFGLFLDIKWMTTKFGQRAGIPVQMGSNGRFLYVRNSYGTNFPSVSQIDFATGSVVWNEVPISAARFLSMLTSLLLRIKEITRPCLLFRRVQERFWDSRTTAGQIRHTQCCTLWNQPQRVVLLLQECKRYVLW